MAKRKIQPKEIRDRPVRILKELAALHDLSPFSLSPIVKASAQQIYRWFAGDRPKPGSLILIERAVQKIEADFPEPEMETPPSGAQASEASWSTSEEDFDADAIAKEETTSRELSIIFGRLMTVATDPEKHVFKIAWPGFAEIVKGLRRHDINFRI
jgi:hypothetical protein